MHCDLPSDGFSSDVKREAYMASVFTAQLRILRIIAGVTTLLIKMRTPVVNLLDRIQWSRAIEFGKTSFFFNAKA